MLCTADWEFVCGVKVDDFWDCVKGRAVLSQYILAIFALREPHVHETLAAPVRTKHKKWIQKERRQKEERDCERRCVGREDR